MARLRSCHGCRSARKCCILDRLSAALAVAILVQQKECCATRMLIGRGQTRLAACPPSVGYDAGRSADSTHFSFARHSRHCRDCQQQTDTLTTGRPEALKNRFSAAVAPHAPTYSSPHSRRVLFNSPIADISQAAPFHTSRIHDSIILSNTPPPQCPERIVAAPEHVDIGRQVTAIMSATPTLERNEHTGLSDSTSSISAEKFRLDEADDTPILLYKYRGGLSTSSQKKLCSWLDKGESLSILRSARAQQLTPRRLDESLRVTKKAIPRYTSYVDVKRHDLYTSEEKEQYAEFPNFDSNLASVKIPSSAYWSRLILGNYQNLYIISPESSPASSQADEDSRRTSPSSTWGREDQEGGASQEDSQHR